jgi:hypothetical protein
MEHFSFVIEYKLNNLCTLLHLLHQKKLFEQKFVLLFNIFSFFNGSAAILPSSESSFKLGWHWLVSHNVRCDQMINVIVLISTQRLY